MDVMAAVVARDMACLILGCCQHLGEFDAGFVTHLVQHPDHILGGQVAGGTGSKGTAAQTAQSGLNLGDAALDGCHGVDHAQSTGVVEMDLQIQGGIAAFSAPMTAFTCAGSAMPMVSQRQQVVMPASM